MLLSRAGGSGSASSSALRNLAGATRYASTDTSLAPRDLPGVSPKAIPRRIKPVTSSHYTGSPAFVDNTLHLQSLSTRILSAFKTYSIPFDSPLAKDQVRKAQQEFVALKHEDMNRLLRTELSSAQYRSLSAGLSKIVQYRPFVKQHFGSGDFGEREELLARELEETLINFDRNADEVVKDDTQYASYLSRSAHVDSLGRAYALGRRKEASARVWIIAKTDMSEKTQLSSLGNTIIVNDKPIHTYFPRDNHRNSIIMPLRATGLLGAFNIFALTRGGGLSGQAGAIQHGIAKALICHFDDKARKVENTKGLTFPEAQELRKVAVIMRDILVKQQYAKRDPRMVERKKTNRLKARKAPTWVKR